MWLGVSKSGSPPPRFITPSIPLAIATTLACDLAFIDARCFSTNLSAIISHIYLRGLFKRLDFGQSGGYVYFSMSLTIKETPNATTEMTATK